MRNATLDALALFPLQLEAHFAAVPAGFRHWAPASWDGIPSERLTAAGQVCHVRDVELDGYHVRLQRVLREHNPFLPDLDSEGLARERDYANADVLHALAAFREARATTVDLISRLDAAQLARPAVFGDYGAVTLRSLAHYLCSHDQQHLAGLQWLLGKLEAERASPR